MSVLDFLGTNASTTTPTYNADSLDELGISNAVAASAANQPYSAFTGELYPTLNASQAGAIGDATANDGSYLPYTNAA